MKIHSEQYVDGLQSMIAFPETLSGMTCPSYGTYLQGNRKNELIYKQ